jgi:hypothetical protein
MALILKLSPQRMEETIAVSLSRNQCPIELPQLLSKISLLLWSPSQCLSMYPRFVTKFFLHGRRYGFP